MCSQLQFILSEIDNLFWGFTLTTINIFLFSMLFCPADKKNSYNSLSLHFINQLLLRNCFFINIFETSRRIFLTFMIENSYVSPLIHSTNRYVRNVLPLIEKTRYFKVGIDTAKCVLRIFSASSTRWKPNYKNIHHDGLIWIAIM